MAQLAKFLGVFCIIAAAGAGLFALALFTEVRADAPLLDLAPAFGFGMAAVGLATLGVVALIVGED